jgi:N-acetylmuramate 1-kinase
MLQTNDTRLEALHRWLAVTLRRPEDTFLIAPASSDASFRRYFRVTVDTQSLIAMDAPPSHEDVRPFLHVARLLRKAGVHAPAIHADNIKDGFLLLEDFGSINYLDELDESNADALYLNAMNALATAQRAIETETSDLPAYDETLLQKEMTLFEEWFVGRLCHLQLNHETLRMLSGTFQRLANSALEQPRGFVHRDYHSRNLMLTATDTPGVIDFQDAVVGPVTYDLVSLLRDCYIAWPQHRIDAWVDSYRQQLLEDRRLTKGQNPSFSRWFDWMGIQRHLKAVGIFARLKLRDNKPGYLQDIPRTLSYIHEIAGRYQEFSDLARFLENRVLPDLPDILRKNTA